MPSPIDALRHTLPRGLVLVCTALFGLALLWADNLYGYARFRYLCATEAGLKVLTPLRVGAGWTGVRPNDAEDTARVKGVGFVRVERDGRTVDVRYVGGSVIDSHSYRESPADENVRPAYRVHVESRPLPSPPRTSVFRIEIVGADSSELLVSWTQFQTYPFDPSGLPLGPGSPLRCDAPPSPFDSTQFATVFSN